jgi:phosphoribosylglycinamide formyltransferase-1
VVDHRRFASREDFEARLAARIDAVGAGLVVLAGFMRILTAAFVSRYAGRLMNIHPSLLPKFPGLDTHQRAIDAGESEHGASVHFVVAELDSGPVIAQARVPILAGDDAESLAARVLRCEHVIYPQAIRWFAEGRLRIEGGRVLLDGRPALSP